GVLVTLDGRVQLLEKARERRLVRGHLPDKDQYGRAKAKLANQAMGIAGMYSVDVRIMKGPGDHFTRLWARLQGRRTSSTGRGQDNDHSQNGPNNVSHRSIHLTGRWGAKVQDDGDWACRQQAPVWASAQGSPNKLPIR